MKHQLAVLRLSGLALALLIILLAFCLSDNFSLPVMGEFGALIYFYYAFKPDAGGLKTMAAHGFLAWCGFGILLFMPQIILLKTMVLAILAVVTMATSKRFFPNPIGPFFVIMIASLGGTVNVNGTMSYWEWNYLGFGMLAAFGGATLVEWIARHNFGSPAFDSAKLPLMPRHEQHILSLGYGMSLFLAFGLNLLFPYHSYNWLTVSAAANLKANTNREALTRYGWYVLGNIAGVIIIYLVGLLDPSTFALLVLSVILFVAIAIVININYGLALALATPLAVFLFNILHGTFDNQLISIRLQSILIGSFIGIICDLLIIYALRKQKA